MYRYTVEYSEMVPTRPWVLVATYGEVRRVHGRFPVYSIATRKAYQFNREGSL